jgi:lysophospholipase L1-like esterase
MLCVLSLLLTLVGATLTPTVANASVSTIAWPGVPMPYSVTYAHGDGSVSVLSDDCSYHYNYPSSSPAIVTYNPNQSATYTVNKGSGSSELVPCNQFGDSVAGSDGTIYFVRQVNSYAQQIVAMRNGAIKWVQSFTPVCTDHVGVIYSLSIGYDGDLYLDHQRFTGCSTVWASLTKIDSATGKVIFTVALPNALPAVSNGITTEIMPYPNGVAVVNNGMNVYYYSSSGVLDSSKTFSPSAPSGSSAVITAIDANGRTYMLTGAYDPNNTLTHSDNHLYYKDLSSSTVHEVSVPAGANWQPSTIFATTPSGGISIGLVRSNGHRYFGYFDSSGTETYEVDLSVDTNAGLSTGTQIGFAIDNSGNAIVTRMMDLTISPYDQEVYVDSYSSTGSKTRLFDSEAELGTSAKDSFQTSEWVPQNVGNGKIFLTLCHEVNYTGSRLLTCSDYNGNPQIVEIPTTSQFSYPRSAAFAAINARTQYVALGDSYSAADGNPPFIAPTDNNGGDGCDRSESKAYPELLAADLDFRLSAFVACSGATSDDIYVGLNGEPSQLDSLNADTDIVTVTSGGNDAGFAIFAKECVDGTCDSASSQYQDTMDEIDNYLQDNLELLYSRIAATAPNAAVKVIGYPEVVSSGSCPIYLSGGEQTAIDTVTTSLNNKIQAAVADAGFNFQFISPTATGSPFDGHDLCSSTPYFFGLNIAEHRFSFHPNADGQAAYEELIANSI